MSKNPSVTVSALRRRLTRDALRLGLALTPVCVGLTGCGDPSAAQDQNPLADEPSFAAIPREPVSQAQLGQMQQALITAAAPPSIIQAGVGGNFYLAISKKELDQRYVLSTFAKQYFPTAVSGGASKTMGVAVVGFKLTNGRLYVYEVSDVRRSSRSFAPDAVFIEAYDVVSYAPFDTLPGASNYVLIDPGLGKNRIGISQGGAYGSAPFQIELSLLQNFRRLPDGVVYEHVVTGYSDQVLGDDPNNLFRGVGTVGVSWRRLGESPGFQTVVPADPPRVRPVSDAQMGDANAPLARESAWPSHFFVGVPRRRDADSTLGPRYPGDETEFPKVDQPALRWNISDPNRTIEWVVSPLVPVKYQQTVKDAIESWNKLLGRKVLVARMANPGETYDDDDKNYLVYDGDPSYGAAFANWRANPLTGEFRGASVYMNAIWFQGADSIEKNPFPGLAKAPMENQKVRKPTPRLGWIGMTQPLGCELWAEDVLAAMGNDDTLNNLTGTEQAQRYIFNTVSHEVGHTLGLRHNFKGSLAATANTADGGSSVMEYQTARQGIAGPGPGVYDQAAIDLLYKLKFGEYTLNGTKRTGYLTPGNLGLAFCTDNGVTADPNCQTFDEGKTPLTEWHIPRFDSIVTPFITGQANGLPSSTLNNVAMFLRAGSSSEQLTAWNKMIERIKVGVVAPMNPPADYGPRVAALTLQVYRRLFLDDASLVGNISAAVPTSTTWLNRYLPELRGILVNTDGLRSYASRRAMVDILKKFQVQAAFDVLVAARATLATQVVPPASADLQADLIARVDAAIGAYWAQ